MTTFNFNEHCNKRLFEEFPELRENPKYKETIDDHLTDEETGSHGVYEDAFCYYVLDLIQKNDPKDEAKIKHAFGFIEELIQHEDFNVRCIAKVGFIEAFICKLEPTTDIPKYLGSKSLKAAKDLCATFIKINPITWEKES
jgi:hypothetical protein